MITTSGNTPVTNGIIMYTPSQYDRLLIVLIIFPISVVSLRLFWAILNKDMAAVWSLFSVLGFICLVDLLFLPKGFDVRSNGEIGVITTLITWKFSDILRAELAPRKIDLCDPRWKFATTFHRDHRVILRRHTKWNILVSPVDVEQYIEAVNNSLSFNEKDSSEII